MSTKIQWTDATWSPVVGCTKVSTGCDNCYAEKMACRLASMACSAKKTIAQISNMSDSERAYINVVRMMHDPAREKTYFDGWNGKIALVESALNKPLHWKKPRMIFVNSMSDLFHPSVPFEFIDKVIDVFNKCPQHTGQLLTKRAERMKEYFCRGVKIDENNTTEMFMRPNVAFLQNLWLGVTAENQEWWDKRKKDFLSIPAVVHFVSNEPCLGGIVYTDEDLQQLDWVIVGAESGPKSRWCPVGDIRSIVGQCKDAGVPVFVKQIHIWDSAKKKHKLIKDINQFPEDLRIREYPKGGVKNE